MDGQQVKIITVANIRAYNRQHWVEAVWIFLNGACVAQTCAAQNCALALLSDFLGGCPGSGNVLCCVGAKMNLCIPLHLCYHSLSFNRSICCMMIERSISTTFGSSRKACIGHSSFLPIHSRGLLTEKVLCRSLSSSSHLEWFFWVGKTRNCWCMLILWICSAYLMCFEGKPNLNESIAETPSQTWNDKKSRGTPPNFWGSGEAHHLWGSTRHPTSRGQPQRFLAADPWSWQNGEEILVRCLCHPWP